MKWYFGPDFHHGRGWSAMVGIGKRKDLYDIGQSQWVRVLTLRFQNPVRWQRDGRFRTLSVGCPFSFLYERNGWASPFKLWERKEPLAYGERKTQIGLDLRGGLFAFRMVDEPNEADLSVLTIWGLGRHSLLDVWILPWRRFHDVH